MLDSLHSFNRHANTYNLFANIQQQIAKYLIQYLKQKDYTRVLDLGSGSGAIFKALEQQCIFIKDFIALDNSINMLKLHPTHSTNIQRVSLEHADFEKYAFKTYDLIVASSSLQWAKDLKSVLEKIACSSKEVALAIHTDFSLHEVHEFLGTTSPLRNLMTLKSLIKNIFKDFQIELETKRFILCFENQKDGLNHLKKCGLLGGSTLNFKQKKHFLKNMVLEKLSYEALLFSGIKRS
ncbi:methyltransferase domain-containing protein [Helicobacter cetorum]|uniref:Biotin synthesis protein BioC n=1 Tax=Helicobacter cetorum (strain ATCC BAA-540 / CCUG 52418 / MIT 99-5656) TaxID=1163745 RepID=I0EQ89_HELCM|nr:methyltransferase domain-containing protein [Helicobacter cetorum]AFI05108.1 biotin synthesis protein BioC [Helicobacter cetorum MIT 99-5656]